MNGKWVPVDSAEIAVGYDFNFHLYTLLLLNTSSDTETSFMSTAHEQTSSRYAAPIQDQTISFTHVETSIIISVNVHAK